MTLSDKLEIALFVFGMAVSISVFVSNLFTYRLKERLDRLERKLFGLSVDNASVIPEAIQREVVEKLRKQMEHYGDDIGD